MILKKIIFILLLFTCNLTVYSQNSSYLKKLSQIRVRDPFILTDSSTMSYYLYVSMANQLHYKDSEQGVIVYKSTDLKYWDGPFTVFKVQKDFWAQKAVWAPEVHKYKNRYYLFVTFTSSDTLPDEKGRPTQVRRGTQILYSNSALGPFHVFQNHSTTPQNWMTLDGTFWINNGKQYMIFCHEWVQITDGEIDLIPLKSDLSGAAGEPVALFKATDASWVTNLKNITVYYEKKLWNGYVTDGPYLYRTKIGHLLMIWSSFGKNRYAIGIAKSESGNIYGP